MWTSSRPVNGLRHFVLVNKIKEKDQIKNLMVSVLDVDVILEISNEELIDTGRWSEGWLNLDKSESITKNYSEFKSSNYFKKEIRKIFINNNSIFNIS